MNVENTIKILILFTISFGLFLIGISECLDYVSCKQKAEFYKDSRVYVYKFPAGCLMMPVKE